MTDRELLEMAAKAAGYWSHEFNCPDNVPRAGQWDPLTDDGDALRLENILGMQTQWTMLDEPEYASVAVYRDRPGSPVREFERLIDHAGDRSAARRRAIVRAAASIGEKL